MVLFFTPLWRKVKRRNEKKKLHDNKKELEKSLKKLSSTFTSTEGFHKFIFVGARRDFMIMTTGIFFSSVKPN